MLPLYSPAIKLNPLLCYLWFMWRMTISFVSQTGTLLRVKMTPLIISPGKLSFRTVLDKSGHMVRSLCLDVLSSQQDCKLLWDRVYVPYMICLFLDLPIHSPNLTINKYRNEGTRDGGDEAVNLSTDKGGFLRNKTQVQYLGRI